MKRKIAAIMCADVVGYSRLVAEDEEEALRRLLSYRSVFEGFIDDAGGRIFNTAGDAILAEFPSAVEAVRAAIDIQESLRTRNLAYPKSRQMYFRMGITIGDVVEQDGDLLGDAVNIAARLQTLAQPGGICLSQSVREQVSNKLSAHFRDLGPQAVKNIPQEIHAFTVEFSEAAETAAVPVKQTGSSRARVMAILGVLIVLGASAAAYLVFGGGLATNTAPPQPEVADLPPPPVEDPAPAAETAPVAVAEAAAPPAAPVAPVPVEPQTPPAPPVLADPPVMPSAPAAPIDAADQPALEPSIPASPLPDRVDPVPEADAVASGIEDGARVGEVARVETSSGTASENEPVGVADMPPGDVASAVSEEAATAEAPAGADDGIPLPPARPQPAYSSEPMAGRAFHLEDIPFVCDSCRGKIDRQFARGAKHRALALNARGDTGWGWGWSEEKGARDTALEGCLAVNNRECELYAVDDQVVWAHPAPVLPNRPWVRPDLDSGPFSADGVAFIGAATRAILAKEYQSAGNPKAVAVAPGGSWAYFVDGESDEEVMRRALESCSHHAEDVCMIAALNDELVNGGGINEVARADP